jgi:hypothetical protein
VDILVPLTTSMALKWRWMKVRIIYMLDNRYSIPKWEFYDHFKLILLYLSKYKALFLPNVISEKLGAVF